MATDLLDYRGLLQSVPLEYSLQCLIIAGVFSSLPAGFDWMALYGSLTDTKTVIYIGRKSDKQYIARYLTGSNAAAA